MGVECWGLPRARRLVWLVDHWKSWSDSGFGDILKAIFNCHDDVGTNTIVGLMVFYIQRKKMNQRTRGKTKSSDALMSITCMFDHVLIRNSTTNLDMIFMWLAMVPMNHSFGQSVRQKWSWSPGLHHRWQWAGENAAVFGTFYGLAFATQSFYFL